MALPLTVYQHLTYVHPSHYFSLSTTLSLFLCVHLSDEYITQMAAALRIFSSVSISDCVVRSLS